MWLKKKKAEGDLRLGYDAVAGYTLGWLPFTKRIMGEAFPHLTIKAQSVPAYGAGEVPGFAFYADDPKSPPFASMETEPNKLKRVSLSPIASSQIMTNP